MAKTRSAIYLNVFLNSRLVGYLQRRSNGAIEFHYDDKWLHFDKALPISLSLPLRSEKYSGAEVSKVLDNLLPDNEKIRHQIAARVGAKSNDVIDLLAAIGHDCVGALRFLTEGASNSYEDKITGRQLTEIEVLQIIKNLTQSPLGIDEIDEFRISLAGAQEKTALLFFKNKWMLPKGTTPTTHILKPQIGKLRNGIDLSRSVENEHFCLEFLKNLNLPCAKSQIIDFADERVLVVERFDRLWTKKQRLLRIPQEDCCQAFGISSSQKYESDGGPGITQILNLLNASDNAQRDKLVFFKSQIINWLLAATDAHAKNYSISLFPKGIFHLAPLYDVMSVQPYFDRKQIRLNKMKMAMAVGSQRHYIVDKIIPRHFIQTAKANGFDLLLIKNLFEELIVDVPVAITKTLNDLANRVPDDLMSSITDGVDKRLELIRNYDFSVK